MQEAPQDAGSPPLPCDFCDVVARRAPATVRYEDTELIVFRNTLRWVPVMLLVAPKRHMDQEEFWGSRLFARAAGLALKLGREDCPQGFRILSNFGRDALQTQKHGHLHLLGGADLGLYMHPGGHAPTAPVGYGEGPPGG